MPKSLREGLHWCTCDGRAIFLDLRRDRYFCLPGKANAAFLRAAAGDPRAGDDERLDPLVRRGLLIESRARQGIQSAAEIELPQGDFPSDPEFRPGLADIIRSIASELRISRSLQREGLLDVVEIVRRTMPTSRCVSNNDHEAIQSLVSAAAVTALILRSHDRCLVRGLAFQAACRKRGLNTKLVMGAIAHPFTAHCWVQLGNLVLVGSYEQARLFTPILVVE